MRQNKPTTEVEVLRLSKLMANRGICSRREADEYIQAGWVSVNGEVIQELGTKVSSDVRIELSAEALQQQKGLVTILLNKPIGYVSAQAEEEYTPAIKLLTLENYFAFNNQAKFPQQEPLKLNNLAVAGRLDIDSQGLLIFTQDGRVAKQLIGENSLIEKEYLVRIEGEVSPEKLKFLSEGGLVLDGKRLKPAKVTRLNEDQLKFILNEGKKRQVRRMCEAVDLVVKGLKRVRVGQVMLGPLPEGQWRFLAANEKF